MPAAIAMSLLLSALIACQSEPASEITQLAIEVRVKPEVSADGLQFRDLNGDGRLNPYEDWRLTPEQRAHDLLSHMTLEEKAGAMMHASLVNRIDEAGRDDYVRSFVAESLNEKKINSFVTRLSVPPRELAVANNRIQELAEAGRLGIPISISTDPRHHFEYVLGATSVGVDFSVWPEPLGFAALADAELVRTFADTARQDYRAVGIHVALSPQADLATEPRWPRQIATFGSDPALVSTLAGAYVEGFQGAANGLTGNGVLTITKHWVGYSAAVDGFDAHNYYGRFADVAGGALQNHINGFQGALDARTGGIMSSYSVLLGADLDGDAIEPVNAGFNRQLLTDLLREQKGFSGILLSDWGTTNDCNSRCLNPTENDPQDFPDIATNWGVQVLTEYERFIKGVRAGLDQFGNGQKPEMLVQAVINAELTEQRLDASVTRIMLTKFVMGLFDNPYVDPEMAADLVGGPESDALANDAQRRSQVLLKNQDNLLPISEENRAVWVHGLSADAIESAGLTAVDNIADADFAIVRAQSPREMLHPYHVFGRRQDEGRLNFAAGDPAYDALLAASAQVPTVFAIFLDRPAVLSNVIDSATAIVGNFGATDTVILDVILGKARPEGRLPFELPSSMTAVEAQHPGVPDDSAAPLYPAGFGLDYR